MSCALVETMTTKTHADVRPFSEFVEPSALLTRGPRCRIPWWLGAVFLVLVLVNPLAMNLGPLRSGPSSPLLALPAHGYSPVGPARYSASGWGADPASALQQAQASLSRGEGPAGGHPMSCSRRGSNSESCSATDVSAVTAAPAPSSTDVWSQLYLPSPRHGAAMTYDSFEGIVLLFGGGSNNQYLGDTWEFSQGQWTSLAEPGGPSPRAWAYFADLADLQTPVLFGGENALGPLNDTWEWNTRTDAWVALPTTHAPSPRYQGNMVYDADHLQLVLFGGVGCGSLCGDTWTFNGTWTRLSESTPPSARRSAAMTYDPLDHYAILFGGWDGSADLQDTWAFQYLQWHIIYTAVGSTPSVRGGAMIATDNAGYPTLFGGNSGPYLGDTWVWNGGVSPPAWVAGTQSTPTPPPRDSGMMAYDAVSGYAVLFGGCDPCDMGDVWQYTNSVGWSQQVNQTPFGASAPPPRTGFGLTYDGSVHKVMLFGGYTFANALLNDLWSFDGTTWTQLCNPCTAPGGPAVPPDSPALWAYDAQDQLDLLMDGYTSGGTCQVFRWAYVALTATWTQLAGGPSEGGCNLDASPPGALPFAGLMIYGAFSANDFETWNYQYTAGWTRVTTATVPSYLDFCGATFRTGGVVYPVVGSAFGGSLYALEGTGGTQNWVALAASGACNQMWSNATYADVPDFQLFTDRYHGYSRHPEWDYAGGSTWANVTSGTEPMYGFGTATETGWGFPIYWGGYEESPSWYPNGPTYSRADEPASYVYGGPYTTALSVTSSLDVGQGITFTASSYGTGTSSFGSSWTLSSPINSLGSTCFGTLPSNGTERCLANTAVPGKYDIYATALETGLGLTASSAAAPFTVYADPIASVPSASLNPVDDLETTTLTAHPLFGTGTYSFVWNSLPSGCATVNSATLTCTPAAGVTGVYPVTTTVTDSNGMAYTSVPLNLTVEADPGVPSFTATPSTIDLGSSSTLSVTTSGGAPPFSYVYSSLPAGCTTTNAASFLCTPTATGSFTIHVIATDATGKTAQQNTSLAVSVDPSITSFTASPAAVDVGMTSTIAVAAAGGVLPYSYAYSSLPPGCSSSNGASISCTPTGPGTFGLHVIVTDGTGRTVQANTSLTVNALPAITSYSASPSSLDVGQTTTFTVAATGGTGTLTYVYGRAPTGCTAGSASSFTCIPTAAGSYTVSVTVTDALGRTAWGNATILVSVLPSITSFVASPTLLDLRQTVSLTVAAAGGTAPLTYAYAGLPSGCTSGTGTSFACTSTLVGSFAVHAYVNDSTGAGAQSNASFTVDPDPSVSAFSVTPSAIAPGSTATFSVKAAGGTGPLTYLYTGLPSGCTSANASTLPCTPSATGSFTVTVLVSDHLGMHAWGNATLTVASSLPTLASSSISPTASSLAPGQTQVFSASSLDTAGAPLWGVGYTWTLSPSSLGMLNMTTGSEVLFTAGPSGLSGTLWVNGTFGTVTKGATATIAVSATAPALGSTLVAPTSTSLGIGRTQVFTASSLDTSGAPLWGVAYTWSVTPASLGTLNATTGSVVLFTAGSGNGVGTLWLNGTFGSQVKGATASISVSSTGGGGSPTIVSFAANPSTIMLSSNTTFKAMVHGGAAPYHYGYNGLPPGCTSSDTGNLTCVPTTAGHYNVTLTVTDSTGKTVSAVAELSVLAQQPPQGPPPSSGLGVGAWILIALAVAVVAVLIAVMLLRKSRKGASPQGSPSATSAPEAATAASSPEPAPEAATAGSTSSAGGSGSQPEAEGGGRQDPPRGPSDAPAPDSSPGTSSRGR